MHPELVLTVNSSSEVRQGVLTFRSVPCICTYGRVEFGCQARGSDVSLCTVHLCLRWSRVRRSVKVFRRFLVHRALVHTVKSKFLCAPCICTYGEFMLFRCEIELISSIFFIYW